MAKFRKAEQPNQKNDDGKEEDTMKFDYSKLLGRIKERGYTQESLAMEVGMSVSTMSLKLNNRAFFSQKEIRSICDLLDIPVHQIGEYFFAQEVQKN